MDFIRTQSRLLLMRGHALRKNVLRKNALRKNALRSLRKNALRSLRKKTLRSQAKNCQDFTLTFPLAIYRILASSMRIRSYTKKILLYKNWMLCTTTTLIHTSWWGRERQGMVSSLPVPQTILKRHFNVPVTIKRPEKVLMEFIGTIWSTNLLDSLIRKRLI